MFKTNVDVTFTYTAPTFGIRTDIALAKALNYNPKRDRFHLKKRIALGVLMQITDENGPLPSGTYNLKLKYSLFNNDGDAQFVRLS